tara:strand:- start:44 stop:343 length:300 start_codon:yes stop_codon:yes gene_type:complete
MKKLINGIEYDLTSTEIAEVNARNTEWNNGALDRALSNLRQTRNSLLARTDWTQINDNGLSDAKKAEYVTYRQQLRDLTIGLTTVELVEAVVFPTEVTS